MSRHRSIRTRALIAGGLLTVAGLVAGCSNDGDGGDTANASDTSSSGDWETVTTSGAFGEAEISERPERVLALSPTDADILLSIGVTPVALPTSAQTDAATGGTGMFPWQEDLYPEDIEKLTVEPEGVNIEEIASVEPDLIVATTFFGLDESVYGRLSEIAPVVHFDTAANADPWQENTEKVAEAVGESEAADRAVATAEGTLTAAREGNPELEGKIYNAVISPTPDTLSILCSDQDNLARVLDSLGMELSEYANSVECEGGKQPISWENLRDLDADVIWAIPDTTDQMDELEDNEAWRTLPAVEAGHVVTVPKTEGVPFALSFPSPLSLAWATDQMVPQFAEALG